MQLITRCILLVTILALCLTSQLKSEEPQNVSKANLYAASILPSGQDQKSKPDESILVNKKIRIINLGPFINWEGLDYAPTISADGRTLFYVSNRPGSKLTNDGEYSHDFWAAKKNESTDTFFVVAPYNIDTTTIYGKTGVNTQLNEGAASIAGDKQTLYFTGCDRPDGLGNCDIYVTTIQGDKWSKPVNLGRNVNSKYWDSQPSISPDGKKLFFTSNRPGPHGDNNFDIWYSDYDDDLSEWKPAQNLKEINTSGKDVSPFIAADGVTLFFASDGLLPTNGKQDFYVTRYNEEAKTWSTPENLDKLSPGINTPDDEQFITLPASGDIIYFSSRRTDLPGYQGNFDIFMAFVPSYFRAIDLKVSVVDQCSGENIPATVQIKNPKFTKILKDSLNGTTKIEAENIVTNADFGYGKEGSQYIDFEITASNPKYKSATKIERINKPPTTTDENLTKKYASEVKVVIPLGQKPEIGTIIDEAAYVTKNKKQIPSLAKFNGLVMEQVLSWDLYPLLNYVFFDQGSSIIPDRYILFSSPEETKGFTDSTIAGGTLDKYYHVLNIYGYRLTKNPDTKIEIVGCNDGTTSPEKKPGLSKSRAQQVYNYFVNVWNIDENRLKLSSRDKPAVISNLKDSLGITENRRVEIHCDNWEIMKPIFDKDPKTFPQPEKMQYTMKNGIEDAIVAKRRIEIMRGNYKWKTLTDIGLIEDKTPWDWKSIQNKYPKDEVPYTAQLIITTKTGAECKSDPINIPVMQVTTEKKKVQEGKDSLYETYNLILFPFDKSETGPINERIMRDYVYDRCRPTSVITVIGHTDVVGLYDHNKGLSERRANMVYNGIMKQSEGKVAYIEQKGVGEDEPLYNNELPEGRFYNRTVQVKITTPTSEYDKK